MTKKICSILLNLFLIIIFTYIFIYSNNVKEIIIYGINIWLYNLFPSIFPFLLITKLMIYSNFIDKISFLFGYYISKMFYVSKCSSYAIILSMFTGFPTGAIYTKELLDNNKIEKDEANRLITFTSFANPIFIISFVGEALLNNKSLGIFIYIIHIISGLFTSYIFKNNKSIKNTKDKVIENNSFSIILLKSIHESFITLINMLGIVVFFLIVLSIIDALFTKNIITILLKGFLEITTGLISISKTNINLRLKSAIIGLIISFNGISVHFQVKSIIDNSSIKYKNYLIARIIHSIICFITIYLLYYLFFNQ